MKHLQSISAIAPLRKRGATFRRGTLAVIFSIACFYLPNQASAICGLDGVVREQLRGVNDPQTARTLIQKTHLHGTCYVCHLAKFGGPRNEFGNAINTLLTLRDREDPKRQREVGRRMNDILANPSLPNSPTFGELFQQGRFPASSLANQEPPLPEVPARISESVTAEQARELVKTVESESRFGMLQLSRTYEITPEVAEALAEFRGDTLILGIKSLSLEVATALANSQAANVWLHSVKSVLPEAAETIAKMRSHLVLTNLTELDSVPLAEKLASRPGALSFPHLKEISPEIAAALAKNERSLTLAGLADVASEVQEKLANTGGALSLPNIRSLESIPLARKLTAIVVLLPKVEQLTVKQLEQIVGVKGQESLWGSIYLPVAAMTPEIARAIAANPRPGSNLTLVGSEPLSDEVLRTLLKSRLKLTLRDVESLPAEQIRIVARELADTKFVSMIVELPRFSLPNLSKLDSALLAETLVKSTGFNFPRVTSISPEVATALGRLPDEEVRLLEGVETRPSGLLSFPSLEELSPETARLLLTKRYVSISLPALQRVSLETVRLMARQTIRLNLGIPALPPEFADAFAGALTDSNDPNSSLALPNVTDLSPEAARILVKSLNRGFRNLGGQSKVSNAPRLSFGGLKTLSPELAMELAKYEGSLEFQGLNELPDESAAALASFPGRHLVLSGPATEKLSPKAAEALAKVPGVLYVQLKVLDSVPLAERFAREIGWTPPPSLEIVSREAATALSQRKQAIELRTLAVLDSPELARRFVNDGASGGTTFLALTRITSEAAEILATSAKPPYLGLTVLDSVDVASALSKSQQKLQLPRLRAATPEVIAILKEAKSIETPALDTVYVLPPSKGQSK